MDTVTKAKWDKAAKTFDFMNGRGPEERWSPHKIKMFSHMSGKILFLAVGTGLDISFFPPGNDIVGIDISPLMLEKARPRAEAYGGNMEVHEMDVHHMPFEDESFDQIYTSCTFCSVPNPQAGLEALKRVLKPGGEIRMFEHTGSNIFPFNMLLNVMTPLTNKIGPDMNRNTVENVRKAGFQIVEIEHIFLDVVKIITAVKSK